jgi:hypothetical protein
MERKSMIAICTSNLKSGLPTCHPNYAPESAGPRTFGGLEIGESYIVSGLLLLPHGGEFLVCPRLEPRFPFLAPTKFFRVETAALPVEWTVGELITLYGVVPAIGYPRWTSDQLHFEGVLEMHPHHIDVFEEQVSGLD